MYMVEGDGEAHPEYNTPQGLTASKHTMCGDWHSSGTSMGAAMLRPPPRRRRSKEVMGCCMLIAANTEFRCGP